MVVQSRVSKSNPDSLRYQEPCDKGGARWHLKLRDMRAEVGEGDRERNMEYGQGIVCPTVCVYSCESNVGKRKAECARLPVPMSL